MPLSRSEVIWRAANERAKSRLLVKYTRSGSVMPNAYPFCSPCVVETPC